MVDVKSLNTIILEGIGLKNPSSVFNDITSANRRRIKIIGWQRELSIEEVNEINKKLFILGWKIFDHSIWNSPSYNSYVIRIEKLVK